MLSVMQVVGMATASVAVVLVVGFMAMAARRERQRQLLRGEIREMGAVWSTVAGRRIFARASTAAGGPDRWPVVLVHGLGVSSSYFIPTAERLATGFAVYAPDLPGHGRSHTPPEPMDVPRLADALVAWMNTVGLERAAMVGNSMGCQIIVDAAVRHPDRVDRLVLVDPCGDPSARTVAAHAWRLIRDIPFERPGLIPVVLADYLRMGLRISPELGFMLRERMEDKLPRVGVPTMLVGGEHDPISPRRWLEQAAGLARAERVVIIPWWGHAVNFSAAGPLVEAIAPFLREARRRPAVREVAVRWESIARDAPARPTAGHGV